MARYISDVFSDIRGSLSGNVFSKSKSGSFVKNKRVTPSLLKPKQAVQRSQWAFLASSWRNLMDIERAVWHEQAGKRRGFQLFMKCNSNLLLIGLSLLTVPCCKPVLPTYSSEAVVFSPVPGVSVIGVSIDTNEDLSDYQLVAYATGPLSSGIKHVTASNYRYIAQIEGSEFGDTFVEFNLAWQAAYGNPAEYSGSQIAMKVKLVHILSGRATPFQYVSAIIP